MPRCLEPQPAPLPQYQDHLHPSTNYRGCPCCTGSLNQSKVTGVSLTDHRKTKQNIGLTLNWSGCSSQRNKKWRLTLFYTIVKTQQKTTHIMSFSYIRFYLGMPPGILTVSHECLVANFYKFFCSLMPVIWQRFRLQEGFFKIWHGLSNKWQTNAIHTSITDFLSDCTTVSQEWLVRNFYKFFCSSLEAVNLVAFILKV